MATLREMAAEVREVNIALGWRDENKTFGDYIALLHSEVAEALEAYRDHRLADATLPKCGVRTCQIEVGHVGHGPGKPEGVGSEFADILIRLLDTADVRGLSLVEPDLDLADVDPFGTPLIEHTLTPPYQPESFGDFMAWLHRCIDHLWSTGDVPLVLRTLVTTAEYHGIDLSAEYARKIAYNRTRPYQHGGRTLADAT